MTTWWIPYATTVGEMLAAAVVGCFLVAGQRLLCACLDLIASFLRR